MEEEKNEQVEEQKADTSTQEQNSEESGSNAGVASSSPDYGTIMTMLESLQANQAHMTAQIKAISDAQSVLVESGAVVHEIPASQINTDSNSDNDGFISLEDMDFSI